MKVAGNNRVTDWPKLGPSLLIATALVVAIRTARWAAKQPPDALCSDIDEELDREISFAIRMTDRVLGALLQKRQGLFPTRLEPFYEAGSEEDVQR